ncbi:MAG TPA: hypothetical protein VK929_13110 [Longimicrobiales bacterium]|nr:hypothetical protein [Longimicrobiales bacterium]
MLTRVRNTVLAGAAVFALAACDDTTTSPEPHPTVADMAGTYTATSAQWTATADAGINYDLIQAGGSYEMQINQNGTVTTRVVRDGFDDVTGTGTIALDQQGNMTFTQNGSARPIEYTFQNNTLSWTDTGAMWDFGLGSGLEASTFQGAFVR